MFKVIPRTRDGLLIHREGGPAILLEAIFRLFTALWTFFAEADGVDTSSKHPLRYQEFLNGIRAPVTETEIVLFAAALVTVAFDGESYVPVVSKPCHSGLKF